MTTISLLLLVDEKMEDCYKIPSLLNVLTSVQKYNPIFSARGRSFEDGALVLVRRKTALLRYYRDPTVSLNLAFRTCTLVTAMGDTTYPSCPYNGVQ